VVILPRDSGRKSTPSVLTFEDQDTIIIGDRDRIATDPAHTVASPKRILGRPIREPDVERFVARAPYRTLEGPDGSVIIEMRGNHYAVPQLIGFLLEDAKKLAERHLGQPVEHAVVSVPISFDAVRVEHLKRAGRMAGLNIVAVIDEPSAAALANRYSPDFGGIVGVYDFGGGTFDFSVVDVSRGDFRVLATSGDTWLGGDDFDEVLASAAANQFWRKHQVDLRNQALEWQRLLFACEVAKRSLTTRERAAISVPEVLRTASGMVDLNFTIDRNVLARAAAPIIEQSLATCNEALHLIGLEPDQLTAVYLSGGTSYMPAVREALAEHFGVPIRTGVPPEHAVCLGAAIHAAQLQLSGGATLESR
ncbi:MAG: Hsp70 family protein, partial [Deltaproteobacteria bacterium]|nr:Hsp70 family protein [Deltaproteobacteria bacterium]